MMAQVASNESHRPGTNSLWRACYWTALALIFAWAVWQRFKLPLDPIADPDTWGYLSPALRKLPGAKFGHTNSRNFTYPGFLFVLLRIFADFARSRSPNISSDFWPVQSCCWLGGVREFSC